MSERHAMILLCYDGSPSAQHALDVAKATFGATPTTLLHVWSPPFPAADSFGMSSGSGGASLVELEQLVRERAHAIAQDGCELARGMGLAVEVRVEPSGPTVWGTILGVAAELDADLIVVGTRGATAVQSALLGSVSNAVVHHSERPVLVVPGASSK